MVILFLKTRLNEEIARIIKNKYWTFASIPVIAGAVGYVTNFVGVQMLFYPIEYKGLQYRRNLEQPYGYMLAGWQGVVPCKRVTMANSMVDVTLSKLLNIKELFSKLQPSVMSNILAESIGEVIYHNSVPTPIVQYFLREVSFEVIQHIEQLISVKDIVVEGMTRDPTTMGSFFQRVGKQELDFLVTSGSYFGFILGLVQMVCWKLYPKSWCLPVGGAAVGIITNWIAIKLIFTPINPVPIGSFVLQGMFLKRQDAVSADISEYLANEILTSEKIWGMILCGENAEEFVNIIRRIVPVLTEATVQDVIASLKKQLLGMENVKPNLNAMPETGVGLGPLSVTPTGRTTCGSGVTNICINRHPLHTYINRALDIESTLTQKSKSLTSYEFERILHPVFEQEEVLLVLAGGVLGFVAGLLQWAGVVYTDLYYDVNMRLKYMNKYTSMMALLKKIAKK